MTLLRQTRQHRLAATDCSEPPTTEYRYHHQQLIRQTGMYHLLVPIIRPCSACLWAEWNQHANDARTGQISSIVETRTAWTRVNAVELEMRQKKNSKIRRDDQIQRRCSIPLLPIFYLLGYAKTPVSSQHRPPYNNTVFSYSFQRNDNPQVSLFSPISVLCITSIILSSPVSAQFPRNAQDQAKPSPSPR